MRDTILKQFTVEDTFNPVTLKSIAEKSEQADMLDVMSWLRDLAIRHFLEGLKRINGVYEA